jgi:predicted Zn-dependent protease
MTVVINDIAANYNLDIVKSHDTGKRLGSEFYGGDYVSKDGKQTITIYQFDDENRLVRVLAHEFGHALGLKHNDNPKAIMYRLMQSDSLNLAPDDIAALKERCSD